MSTASNRKLTYTECCIVCVVLMVLYTIATYQGLIVFRALTVVYFAKVIVHYIVDIMPGYTGEIRKNATIDTSLLGSYDDKLFRSTCTWVYNLFVVAHKHGKKEEDTNNVFEQWNTECNVDGCSILESAVEEARGKFLRNMRDAEEDDKPPVFQVSNVYDYHEVSKTIRYSDYIDDKELLKRFDEYLKA